MVFNDKITTLFNTFCSSYRIKVQDRWLGVFFLWNIDILVSIGGEDWPFLYLLRGPRSSMYEVANLYMFQVQILYSKRNTQELTISSGGEWYTKRILCFRFTCMKLMCSRSNQRHWHTKYSRLYTTWQLSARIRSVTEVRYNVLTVSLLNEPFCNTRLLQSIPV